MVIINLLPWRQQRARYEKHTLFTMVVCATLAALLMVLVLDRCLYYRHQDMLLRLDQLKKEMLWRSGLAKINAAPNNIPAVPNDHTSEFFNRLNQINTNDVCLEQVNKNKNGIDIKGVANSADQLASFLHTSSLISYFSEVKIKQLQPRENDQLTFHLFGQLHAV